MFNNFSVRSVVYNVLATLGTVVVLITACHVANEFKDSRKD